MPGVFQSKAGKVTNSSCVTRVCSSATRERVRTKNEEAV